MDRSFQGVVVDDSHLLWGMV